jgi:hypothetical protein
MFYLDIGRGRPDRLSLCDGFAPIEVSGGFFMLLLLLLLLLLLAVWLLYLHPGCEGWDGQVCLMAYLILWCWGLGCAVCARSGMCGGVVSCMYLCAFLGRAGGRKNRTEQARPGRFEIEL